MVAPLRFAWVCVLTCVWAAGAHAFIISNLSFDPWLTTATGSRPNNGRPVTLTWGFVADGTTTPSLGGPSAPSNLISFLDTTIGGSPFGSDPNDLTERPWFDLFQSSFDRWSELGGVTYVYEPNDDGSNLGAPSGAIGVRGDVRIGGLDVDGEGETLAFNFLPNNGDMVIDTSEETFFGNSNNNFRAFRNTVMHELGHGLALEHIISSTDNLLMAPAIDVSIDGPQLDEVRAIHFYYGDINEKSNNGQGNDVHTNATDLGALALGSQISVGADADVPTQRIAATATDFVSVSNIDDRDYYSITTTDPGLLSVSVTPRGGVFSQSGQGGFPTSFNANERVDLNFSVFGPDGTTELVFTDNAGLGFSDTLVDFELPAAGEYFINVSGNDDTIQLYQLDISLRADNFLEADFNEDSAVNQADLNILEAALGVNELGDTDDDGDTDGADFLLWQRQFNQQIGSSVASAISVPEPASVVLMSFGLMMLRLERSRDQKIVDTL